MADDPGSATLGELAIIAVIVIAGLLVMGFIFFKG
jgi:hypothetical protein